MQRLGSAIPALKWLRQKRCHELNASLGYKMKSYLKNKTKQNLGSHNPMSVSRATRKARNPWKPGAEEAVERATLLAEHPGWSQHKHLQAMSCQGHHSLHPAGIHFIINCCLANKGRVQVKNIQNFQTEGICRARVDSQPLTVNYKYLPSYRPGRATVLSPVGDRNCS